MSKIQGADVKTEAELITAGGSATNLIRDTQIYITADSINKTLDDAITDGDIGANITGAASTIVISDLTVSRAVISNASGKIAVSTTTDAELDFLSGATSSVQTQINAKAPTASPTFTGVAASPVFRYVPQSADPGSPSTGMVFYSDGTPRGEGLWIYNGTNWVQLGNGLGQVSTEWAAYTPTFQGLGTVTGIEANWRRSGPDLEILVRGTAGTVTADELRIGLPPGLTSASAYGAINFAGIFLKAQTEASSFYTLVAASQTYVTVSKQAAGNHAVSTLAGNATLSSSTGFRAQANVRIAGWENSGSEIITSWAAYTPTFTGFGTATAVDFEWRRVNDTVDIRGKFTVGTSTDVEGRISLPASFTSGSGGTIKHAGMYLRGGSSSMSKGGGILIEDAVTYFTFTTSNIFNSTSADGLAKANVSSAIAGSGNVMSLTASTKVSGF